jgi:hypothetical protein
MTADPTPSLIIANVLCSSATETARKRLLSDW